MVPVEYLSIIFILQVSKACVDKALEVGVNFFDTAEVRITLKKHFQYYVRDCSYCLIPS